MAFPNDRPSRETIARGNGGYWHSEDGFCKSKAAVNTENAKG